MRNEVPRPQSQQQLNQSIEYVRNIMRSLRGVPNAQQVLMQALQNNPNMQPILTVLNSNGNWENLAKQMAQQQGIDPNNLVQELLK